jgi:hypothetical protein
MLLLGQSCGMNIWRGLPKTVLILNSTLISTEINATATTLDHAHHAQSQESSTKPTTEPKGYSTMPATEPPPSTSTQILACLGSMYD